MDPIRTIELDIASLLAGVALSGLLLCAVLLALGRWAWNRLVRFKKISLERIDGQPLYVHLSIDESRRPTWWDKLKELNK